MSWAGDEGPEAIGSKRADTTFTVGARGARSGVRRTRMPSSFSTVSNAAAVDLDDDQHESRTRVIVSTLKKSYASASAACGSSTREMCRLGSVSAASRDCPVTAMKLPAGGH